MWYILSTHDALFLVLSLKQTLSQIDIELAVQQFFLLGIVPGTNLQISFSGIIYMCLITLLFLGSRILFNKAKKIIETIDPLYGFPPNFSRFDIIAL